jgi:ABC-2 type transport system ATP-binding protein
LNGMNIADGNIRDEIGGHLFDVPDTADINSIIDGVRAHKGAINSVVPRKKRLEDLFVETVTAKN